MGNNFRSKYSFSEDQFEEKNRLVTWLLFLGLLVAGCLVWWWFYPTKDAIGANASYEPPIIMRAE